MSYEGEGIMCMMSYEKRSAFVLSIFQDIGLYTSRALCTCE
jgi:hypothetical protein